MAQWHLPPSSEVYFKGLNPLIYTCKEKKKIIVRINLIHIKLGDMNKLWLSSMQLAIWTSLLCIHQPKSYFKGWGEKKIQIYKATGF